MRKLIAVLMLTALLLALFTGCNRPMLDTVWSFDQAQILMPDGTVVSGKVEAWRDFEDGDMLQVKIAGQVYLTHSTNVVLWTDK